ncbi:molybdenum cofactor biosynthesis protein MoaB [Candidatus Bathyarchaeota archaeon]|nr:molybdenum cofactor biosynthesis protein MoaB [Candidatus Bathyarchaeota archaeon]
MSETSNEHKERAPKHVRFALLTISTSRYHKKMKGEPLQNVSADLAAGILKTSGHEVTVREVISDDANMIGESLRQLISDSRVDAVVSMGGTGITSTDITIETVAPLLEKELDGFGEAFRRLSYDQIGTSAILTRCTAGLIHRKGVFCLPGSPQAVETALKELIVPEVGHILAHAQQQMTRNTETV